jgi:hypothetical protein
VDTKFDHSEGVKDMTKAAIIISAILVFAGVAAAGSLPGVSGGSDNTPTLDTPSLASTTTSNGTTTGEEPGEDISGPCDEAEHANDPRCAGVAPATTTTVGDDDEAGEDISGPCDEAEHANDPRCTGVAPQAGDDDRADDGDRHGSNRGHDGDDDSGDDHGGNSGHGGGGDDD